MPTPKDERDFPLGGVVGYAGLGKLPKSFTTSEPMVIRDQGYGTDICQSDAMCSVAEDQDGVIFDPLYTFRNVKRIMGDPQGNEWGADLRSTCKSAVDYGFLPTTKFIAESTTTEEQRNFALGANAYKKSDDSLAAPYKKESFFVVSGTFFDTFDKFRSAIWQTRSEKRSVLTGCNWNPKWTNAKNGVVESIGGGTTFGHAVKAYGWDSDYLVLQLSNGAEIGKQGIFTVHRSVVNAAFVYGGFTFLDLPRQEAEYQLRRIGFFKYWLKTIIA